MEKERTESASTDFPYRYRGDLLSYDSERDWPVGWGTFCVDNRARSLRVLPADRPCPFCHSILQSEGRPLTTIDFEGQEYLVTQNHNPTVDGQLLVFPRTVGSQEHRCDLALVDFALINELTTTGFTHLSMASAGTHPSAFSAAPYGSSRNALASPYVVYVNPFPNAAQTEPHLHINALPHSYVPHLPKEKTESSRRPILEFDGTALYRLEMGSYSGFILTGANGVSTAIALAEVHRLMVSWKIPYSLAADASDYSFGQLRVPRYVLVPRSSDYSEAADQRVGALEFFTGVLLPGVKRVAGMTTAQRDATFTETALQAVDFISLERRLVESLRATSS